MDFEEDERSIADVARDSSERSRVYPARVPRKARRALRIHFLEFGVAARIEDGRTLEDLCPVERDLQRRHTQRAEQALKVLKKEMPGLDLGVLTGSFHTQDWTQRSHDRAALGW